MQSADDLVMKVREFLTPKQHALTWINDVRRYHSLSDYLEDQQKRPLHEWDAIEVTKAVLDGVEQQAARLDPQAQRAESRKAIRDFVFLRNLITNYNAILRQFLLAAGPEGANLARMLQLLIVRESFGATAERAAALIGELSSVDTSKRAGTRAADAQAVVAMLDTHSLRPTLRGVGPGTRNAFVKLRLQCHLEQVWEVRCGLVALLEQVYAHQLLEESISHTFFTKHPIMYSDNERKLTRTVKWVEEVAGQYNQFLHHRVVPLIADEPEIARAVSGTGSTRDWRIDLGQVCEAAATLCPELLAQSTTTALGLALVAIGEKEKGLEVLTNEARDDHSDGDGSQMMRELLRNAVSAEGPPT